MTKELVTKIDIGFKCFILENKIPRAATVQEWSVFLMDIANRIVVQTVVGEALVSTVFLGIGDIMFETMIFNGPYDQQSHRDDTWDDAQRTHDLTVERLRMLQVALPAPD